MTPAHRRGHSRLFLALYLIALLASHIVQRTGSIPPLAPDLIFQSVEVEQTTASGEPIGKSMRVAYIDWPGPRPADERPPLVLLHGSPGDASNFAIDGSGLLPNLSAERRSLAIDLPGFGRSSEWITDYSQRAHARAVLAVLDALGIDHAHVVGWSNGGGVALHMADLAPERCASLTLLASIGAQETEGSGSYIFEHAKYAVGYAALVVGGELIPHFGLLGPLHFRHAFLRNFWDSDQRPLADIMARTRVPTLILHGRHDFLTPAWGAELHHRIMPASRLVMLDASHFIPMLQGAEAAEFITEHAARHDTPGVAPLTTTLDLAPTTPPSIAERALRSTPWWALLAIIALLVAWRPEAVVALLGVLCSLLWLDYGVAFAGAWLGMLELHGRRTRPDPGARALWQARARARPATWAMALRFRPWERREGLASGREAIAPHWGWALGTAVGTTLWVLLTLTPAMALAGVLRARAAPLTDNLPSSMLAPATLVGWIALWWIVWTGVRALVLATSRTGRARAAAAISRLWRHEFWPSTIFYLPLVPYFLWLAWRHGGLMTWTCANPGMTHGGGIVGESKGAILRCLHASPAVLPGVVMPAGLDPDARAAEALTLLRDRPELGGLPVILKPDSGARGRDVRIARTADDVRAYFHHHPAAALIQRYHPGPHELGALWVRTSAITGRIIAITHKLFPTLTADGRRTLETLIYGDARLRMQADVFLRRLGARRDDIPPPEEHIAVGHAGNHAQGARFEDGEHLRTPALEAALSEIALAFEPHPDTKFTARRALAAPLPDTGFDFGRFDLRYADPAELAQGRGFAVVELNGTTSESTNLYDPRRSVLWAYSVLFRQWRTLFELGAARRREGVAPIGLATLARWWRDARADHGSPPPS